MTCLSTSYSSLTACVDELSGTPATSTYLANNYNSSGDRPSCGTLLETILATAFVSCVFVVGKSSYDSLRLVRTHATVVIVGSGPAGLLAALIVARTRKASRIIVYEQRSRTELCSRAKYVSLNVASVAFVRWLGVEIMKDDGGEGARGGEGDGCCTGTEVVGCDGGRVAFKEGRWQYGCFTTSLGPLLQQFLNLIEATDQRVEIRFETKFTKECLAELDGISERIIAIVCDGSGGRSACLLGLSDEYSQHSCRSYGAVATIERPSTALPDRGTNPSPSSEPPPSLRGTSPSTSSEPPPPSPSTVPSSTSTLSRLHPISNPTTHSEPQQCSSVESSVENSSSSSSSSSLTSVLFPPEVRVHRLTIGLNSHCNECTTTDPFPMSFHLKIFGGSAQRRMALAVPKCESRLVKSLKVMLDQSVMRNIFQACYNRYKSPSEQPLTDAVTIKCMKFNPRLFEIKLLHRIENVAYIEDANIFVVTEGAAARFINFNSGVDIDLAISGLQSLEQFVLKSVSADNDKTILEALLAKFTHSQTVMHEFVKHGFKDDMYSTKGYRS